MSYESCHMREENLVEICRFRGRSLTMEELVKLNRNDIFAWNKQHYGNTKFEDLAIVIAWFRCRFHQNDAAKMVGYVSEDKDGNQIGAMAISVRLIRINVKDPLNIVRACITAGHITMEDVSDSLKEPLYRKGRLSMAAAWWGRSICKSALKKHKSKVLAAGALGITKKELNIWLNC